MNFNYQGELGVSIGLFGACIWIFKGLSNFENTWIDILFVFCIVIGLILLILWDGE